MIYEEEQKLIQAVFKMSENLNKLANICTKQQDQIEALQKQVNELDTDTWSFSDG